MKLVVGIVLFVLAAAATPASDPGDDIARHAGRYELSTGLGGVSSLVASMMSGRTRRARRDLYLHR